MGTSSATMHAPSGSQDLHLQRITSELANRRRGTVEEAPDSRHERPAVKIKAIIGHDKSQYCICKQPADDSMLQCFGCNNWYHIRCVGFIMKRSRREKYRCTGCTVDFNQAEVATKIQREKEEEERARAEATRQAAKKVKVEQQEAVKKAKVGEDPKPKRPITSWIIFLNLRRHAFMKQNPEMGICDITKYASSIWRDLNADDRAEYDRQASVLKQSYEIELKAYNKRHKNTKTKTKKVKGRMNILIDKYFQEISQKRTKPEHKNKEPKSSKRVKLSQRDTNKPNQLSEKRLQELRSDLKQVLLMMPDHSFTEFMICLAPPQDDDDATCVDDLISTMSCFAGDYPALSSACEQATDAKRRFDMNGISESAELFNATMMFVNPAKDGTVNLLSTPPNAAQTHHIQNQVYHRVIKNPASLNSYQGFSDEVYGEAQHPLISELTKMVPIKKEMVFVDLGSGIGQVVMQVAAQAQCKMCYGIEISETPAKYAPQVEDEFRKRMKQYGKSHGEFDLITGSFLDPAVLPSSVLNQADILFVNNVAFSAQTNQQLLERFSALKEGAKIISMRSFATQVGGRGRLASSNNDSNGATKFKFRCACGLTGVSHWSPDLVDCIQCGVWQHRRCAGVSKDEEAGKQFLCKNCHHYMKKQVTIESGMSMDVLGPFYSKAKNAVSWTSAPVSYFIHTIGRQCDPTTQEVVEPAAEAPQLTEPTVVEPAAEL